MGKLEKNKEIQILRGMAILSVMGIHMLSIGTTNLEVGTVGYWGYYVIHSLLQFAVPCFIMISSIMIAYTTQNQDKINGLQFYKKRFFTVVIPYILWSLIYLLPQMAKGWIPFSKLLSPTSWFYWLSRGKAYTHLYYMSVTVQLCILAPFLLWGVRKLGKWFKKWDAAVIVILAVVSQIGIYYINKFYIRSWFQAQATLVIWYFYIILIGLWIGCHYRAFIEYLKKYQWLVAIAAFAMAVVYIVYKVFIVKGIKISTMYYQYVWWIYVFFASVILLRVAVALKEKGLGSRLETIGNYSFGIYLIHPAFTYWLHKFIKIDQPLLILIIVLISYIVILYSCKWMIDAVQYSKWTSPLLGTYKFRDKAKGRGIHNKENLMFK